MIENGSKKELLGRYTIADKKELPNVAIFLKRTTIEFIQILFSQRPEGSYHFDSDDTKTEIQISDQHAVDLETYHRRPAIIAVRGPLSWQGMGLGANAFQEQIRTTGTSTYTDMLTGSVAFSCFSREGVEAEQLAHLVFSSFKFFGPVLRKYGFFSIKSLNIGSESLIGQDGENDDLYMVPVYVTAQIQDRWRLSDDAARTLEKIIITTLTNI